jgi:hypothetical protein
MKTEKSWTPWQRNLNDPKNRDRIFAEIGTVIDITDTWDPFFHVGKGIEYRYDIL